MQKLLLKDFFFKFYLERQCMKKRGVCPIPS